MAISVSPDLQQFKERMPIEQRSLLSTTNVDPERRELEENHQLQPESSIDTANEYSLRNEIVYMTDHAEKIQCTGFPINNPWLPPRTLKLLKKLRKGLFLEKDLLKLMAQVAERASLHFQLDEGKCVAMTFTGRIVESANTRIDLLKKIHGRKYGEQIFVWRIGSSVFSGRT